MECSVLSLSVEMYSLNPVAEGGFSAGGVEPVVRSNVVSG